MDPIYQVALIIGATSSTGYSYAKYLLQNGVKVALCDTNMEKCKSTANKFIHMFGVSVSILALQCDVTNENQMKDAFISCINHFGRIDIVINNASLLINDSVVDPDEISNINFGGVVRGIMMAIQFMGVSNGGGGGTVIRTSEALNVDPNSSIFPMYKTSKQSVVDYTRAIVDIINANFDDLRIMDICSKSSPDKAGRDLMHILQYGKTGEFWIVEDDKRPRLANL